MEYLWPRYSVRITIERAGDEPIFNAYLPTWRANCRCRMYEICLSMGRC
jgi:hypothetical protein